MYTAHIILMPLFGLVTAIPGGSMVFDKHNQGITDMTAHQIPANTEEVWLHKNSITNVPSGYFVNKPDLYEIRLQDNQISNIAEYGFAGVPSLRNLVLYNNNLAVIRRDMFSGLVNLKQIYLSTNKIHRIESGSFRDCSRLEYMLIEDNFLQILPETMFDFQNHPTDLQFFKVFNNPLFCNESLAWLKDADGGWITVENAANTICTGPDYLSGCSWNQLSIDDLNFDPPGEFYQGITKSQSTASARLSDTQTNTLD